MSVRAKCVTFITDVRLNARLFLMSVVTYRQLEAHFGIYVAQQLLPIPFFLEIKWANNQIVFYPV